MEADGRVVIAWPEDGRRRKKKRKGWTIAQAEAELAKQLARVDAQTQCSADRTLAAFFEHVWIPIYRGQVSPATFDRATPQFLRIADGFYRLCDVNRSTITKYVNACRKDGLSDATIRRDLGLLAQAMDEAVELGAVPRNPVRGPRHRRVQLAPPRPRKAEVLTPAELDRVLLAVGPKYRGVVLLIMDTGFRREQAVQAAWRDVDFDRGLIRAPFAQKGGLRQLVPMSPRLAEMLRDLAKARRQELRVFPEVTTNGLKLHWRRARVRAKFPNLRLHDLRDIYASHLEHLGVSRAAIAGLLGHRTTRTTEDHYLHAPRRDLEAAAAELAEYRHPRRARRAPPSR